MDESAVKAAQYQSTINLISQRFNTEDASAKLNRVKYLCKDLLGARRLEQIHDFRALCTMLERLVKLHEDDVSFLMSLMQNCSQFDNDSLTIIERYRDQFITSRKNDATKAGSILEVSDNIH